MLIAVFDFEKMKELNFAQIVTTTFENILNIKHSPTAANKKRRKCITVLFSAADD